MVVTAKPTHRRYANKVTYQAIKDGVSKGYFLFERKMSDEEIREHLLDIKKMTKADKIILHWSAREGFINREVHL